ncbi:RNA-guided endonuclease InsQ/TnpB family protein [Geminocystis herdmanii]|uniref:RNA-guided endonuclease InsQ/TnpB family protein n=1 Tax=Geminocystis herdmanii TaxID=669359 RepID=UPI00036C6C53|nr:zinc ribbon domain-containing protein [Geminocystis herdmanii]
MINHQEIKGSSSYKIDTIKKLFTNYTKKQPEYAWCNNLSSRVYQNAFRDLKTAYSRYFQGLGEQPVFKRKKDKQSFRVESSNGKVLLEAGKIIKIPTLGTFRLKEAIPFSCVSQTFTISKSADKWFVSFSIDGDRLPPRIHPVIEPVGIDLGCKTFATLSDGNVADLGMYEFKRQLTYKALWYANRVDIIDQWYPSSKKCSNCEQKKETLSLSDRLYTCDECGFECDRDLNASINLEKAPEEVIIEKIGWVTAELTSVDSIKPT